MQLAMQIWRVFHAPCNPQAQKEDLIECDRPNKTFDSDREAEHIGFDFHRSGAVRRPSDTAPRRLSNRPSLRIVWLSVQILLQRRSDHWLPS